MISIATSCDEESRLRPSCDLATLHCRLRVSPEGASNSTIKLTEAGIPVERAEGSRARHIPLLEKSCTYPEQLILRDTSRAFRLSV
jgi:hypothetical protein